MSLHVHRLAGCRPAPLAHYLKALGILRIIAEQADPNVRGWWEDEHFVLMSKLDRDDLARFFIEQYSPSSLFNPWGARSGFYDGNPEKTTRAALNAIETSDCSPLSTLRCDIQIVRGLVPSTKPEEIAEKETLVGALRKTLRGSGSQWMSVVQPGRSQGYPPPAIFGTGGNEGSGSYTASYLGACVAWCTNSSEWHSTVRWVLWGDEFQRPAHAWDGSFEVRSETGRLHRERTKNPFRQFLPDGKATPLDLLLMFEGALVFKSSVSNRSSCESGAASARFLSSPFYFAPHGAGTPSSSELDEFKMEKGERKPGRGEQWFPTWSSPTTLAEIAEVIAEGRCSTGGRRAVASLDAARAVAQHGVARGLSSFIRYGYYQRNNLSSHFAVPLGRITVRQHPQSRLVDDLAPWMDRLQRAARGEHAPNRLKHAERKLANAVFAVLAHDTSPTRWQAVLIAAAEIEALQARGTAIAAGPIPALRPEWVRACDDGSVEWRLAVCLGSAAAEYDRAGRRKHPVRAHWLPLDGDGRGRFKTTDNGKKLARRSEVVIFGRHLVDDATALVERRLIDASAQDSGRLPLVAAYRCVADPSDLAAFIAGQCDDVRLSALARACMAVNWDKWNENHAMRTALGGSEPDAAWWAIRLACLPWALNDAVDVPVDPAIVRRCAAGDGSTAITIATGRLRAHGLHPGFLGGAIDSLTAHRWAAALAFPISQAAAWQAAGTLDPSINFQQET